MPEIIGWDFLHNRELGNFGTYPGEIYPQLDDTFSVPLITTVRMADGSLLSQVLKKKGVSHTICTPAA